MRLSGFATLAMVNRKTVHITLHDLMSPCRDVTLLPCKPQFSKSKLRQPVICHSTLL